MRRTFNPIVLWVLFLSLPGLSCGPTVHLRENIVEYRDEIRELQRRIQRNPDDAEALRELGVIYVGTRHVTRGKDPLEGALRIAPRDPKTRFYLGVAYELLSDSLSLGDTLDYNQRALRLYQGYADVPRSYRKLMQGRYLALSRELARQEVRALLGREDSLNTQALASTTVGVFALRYQGSNPRYEFLGNGLSEMMSIDLAKVQRLTVVERVRLQALRDELAFAETDVVDQASAPRRGLFLGAGTVVGGTYDVPGENNVQLDVASFDIVTDQHPAPVSESSALSNLFDLQKDVVLRLLDEMGIALTPQEQASIRVFPTQNLEAFLAFSRGLQQEDERQFAQAAQSYRQAVAFDENFELARQSAEEAESLAEAGGSPEAALDRTRSMESELLLLDMMVDARLQNLGTNLEKGIVPGTDQREGPEEYLLSPPPAPPPPPDKQ